MLEYLKGPVASLTPTYAVIDCSGVGYLVNITLNTYTELQDKRDAKLLVHEIIREDTHDIFGFATEKERTLFRLLIGVSGVGANTARMILSSVNAPDLERAIVQGDHARLKAVKGIGLKTAQRIIVDLRDKIKPDEITLIDVAQAPVAPAVSQAYEEALAAMTMLGFQRAVSQKALRRIFDADPTVSVESAIKKALTMV